jgi:hypothetical protein
MRTIAFAAVALAAALLPAAGARAGEINAGTETVTSGAVAATLTWDRGEDSPQNTTLTISRGGAVVFQQRVPQVCGPACERDPGDGDDFRLADLDGDGEPEVILLADDYDTVDSVLGVWDYRPATGTYGAGFRNVKNAIASFRDVDRDGTLELITEDLRFESLVPGDLGFFKPPAVLKYERPGGVPRYRDITRSAKGVIRESASIAGDVGFKGLSMESRRDIVGTYVADQFLLGHGAAGIRYLDRRIADGQIGSRRSAAAFRKRLLRLLDRYGYR